MKTSKLNRLVHPHIGAGDIITRVKRIIKTWQIWRIDQQYIALARELDDYATALKAAQSNAELARRHLLIRRAELLIDIIRLGGR